MADYAAKIFVVEEASSLECLAAAFGFKTSTSLMALFKIDLSPRKNGSSV